MVDEERITYQTLRADGESNFFRSLRDVYASFGWGGPDTDTVILRVVGRRISSQGPFKPVSVEIVT